jgi:hypothetical protein
MDVEKLKKMASAVRTGGKGSMRRWLFILVDICKNDALAVMHSYLLHIVLFCFVGLYFSIHVQYVHIHSFGVMFS